MEKLQSLFVFFTCARELLENSGCRNYSLDGKREGSDILRKSFLPTAASLLLLILAFHPAAMPLAQTLRSLTDRVAKADLIVVGQVQDIESRWDDNKSHIWTYVTISVEEYIKGSPPPEGIIIMVPGGIIKKDNIIQELTAPVPEFGRQEKILVMLSLGADRMHYYVVDSTRGKYSIDKSGHLVGEPKTKQEFIEEIKNIMASQK